MSGKEVEGYAITVAGRLNDALFHQARVLARFLAQENVNVTTNSIALTETEWEEYCRAKGRSLGGEAYSHRVSPMVFYNDSVYIGRTPELIAWMNFTFGIRSKSNQVLYTRMANRAFKKYINSHKNPHCYFDISVGGAASHRVVMELFNDTCPKTCENFRALCTGERGTSESGVRLHYKGTPFHRVVPGGWVQGGDVAGGRGDGGESIYGSTFADETFAVKHARAGVLAMASNGNAHSNGSQFYISMAPMPHMDGKRVAFGQVISGMRILRAIQKLPAENQRPTPEVTIADCGVFTGATYGKPPAGMDESKRAERNDESQERMRNKLYARIYNTVDTEGKDCATGEALAEELEAAGGAVFRRMFLEAGRDALEEACRAAGAAMSFEQFCARAEEVHQAVHRGGVQFLVRNPYGEDTRPAEVREKFMDTRDDSAKRRLLQTVFKSVDTSGDGNIDRVELLTALRSETSLLAEHFPTHLVELPRWLEASATDDKVNFEQFFAVCSRALAHAGGH